MDEQNPKNLIKDYYNAHPEHRAVQARWEEEQRARRANDPKRLKQQRIQAFNARYQPGQNDTGDAWRTFWAFCYRDAMAVRDEEGKPLYDANLAYCLAHGILLEVQQP